MKYIKSNGKKILSIFSLSTILGAMIVTQLREDVEDYDMVTLGSIDGLRAEVDNLESEMDILERAVVERKEELSKKERLSKQDDTILIESIEKDIEELRIISGSEDIEGAGIMLTVADNESDEIIGQNINDDIIHDSDIQILLNDLKRAGAEAISINGQRVTSKSEVKCGGPVIKINKKSSANPFVIKVIGDPKSLLASVEGKGTYGETLKNIYKIKVEAEIKNNLHIPGYDFEDFEYEHARSREKVN